jgi:beta-lactamase regulating signal transducer with metallopeptidase domain
MVWVIVGVSLGVVALAAIGYFAFGVFRAVKALSKDVAEVSKLLADASAPMQAGLAGVQSGNGSRPGSAPADR